MAEASAVSAAIEDINEFLKDRDQVIKEELDKLGKLIKTYKHHFRLSDALSAQTVSKLEEEIFIGMDELLETAKIGEQTVNEQVEQHKNLLQGNPDIEKKIQATVEASSVWIREEVIGSVDQWRTDIKRVKMAFVNFSQSRTPISRSITMAVSDASREGMSPYSQKSPSSSPFSSGRHPINRAFTTQTPAARRDSDPSANPDSPKTDSPLDSTTPSRKKVGRAVAVNSTHVTRKSVGRLGSPTEPQPAVDSNKVFETIDNLFRQRDDFMKDARDRVAVLLVEYQDLTTKTTSTGTPGFVSEYENQIKEAMDDYVQCTEECDQALQAEMERYADVFVFYPEKQKELQNRIGISSKLKNQQMLGDLQKYNRQLELCRRAFLEKM